MNLAVGSTVIGDAQIQLIGLRPRAGIYELSLLLTLRTIEAKATSRWLEIHSGRLVVRAQGQQIELGPLRPDKPLRLQQGQHVFPRTESLTAPLQPIQIARLEDALHGADFTAELALVGVGGLSGDTDVSGDTDAVEPLQAKLQKHVPRSDWVAQLRAAGALDILVIEVPMPFSDAELAGPIALLRRARDHFVAANYLECIAACRDALKDIGGDPKALKLFEGESRNAMTRIEREQAFLAALRHYTNKAHHPEGDAEPYARRDAKRLLHLTAACVAHACDAGAVRPL